MDLDKEYKKIKQKIKQMSQEDIDSLNKSVKEEYKKEYIGLEVEAKLKGE